MPTADQQRGTIRVNPEEDVLIADAACDVGFCNSSNSSINDVPAQVVKHIVDSFFHFQLEIRQRVFHATEHLSEPHFCCTIGYWEGRVKRFVVAFFMLAWKHLRMLLPRRKQGADAAREARGRPAALFIPNPKLRLREQLREVMRFLHYSVRTEESYWLWIRRFILFHNKRHPREMGSAEVHAFLTGLRGFAVSP